MNGIVNKTSLHLGQDGYFNEAGERFFHVSEGTGPMRLDAYLADALKEEGISREKIKKFVQAGAVALNRTICTKTNTQIMPGDSIHALLPEALSSLQAETGDLSIIWHDEHIAVLNKPAGLTVHPAPGLESGTLAHRLLHHFPQLAAQGGLRPGIVHRLDKDTSGLMLVALTEKARLVMTGAFADRLVKKQYLALVHGVPDKEEASITEAIGRCPQSKTKMAVLPSGRGGKPAHSDYRVLFAAPRQHFSLVDVALHSGRTHQIRVHMQHLGHALVGDKVYKNAKGQHLEAPRQMLHAWKLAFTHPVSGETLSFQLPPPPDFRDCTVRLAQSMQRIVVSGSPGGGKSSLTQALGAAGLPVWSADEAVKRLYAKGADGWHLLQLRYGQRFVPAPDASVDKSALFIAMRDSESFRRELEELIHPLVFHNLSLFWQEQEAKGLAAAAAEIPLYLETGGKGRNSGGENLLAVVFCPFATRSKRLSEIRHWPSDMIVKMESWQWPEAKKVQAADIVLDNSGSLQDMQQRAGKLPEVLEFLRRQNRLRLETFFASLWGEPQVSYDQRALRE